MAETPEEYQRWLKDPERIRQRDEGVRQIGKAIIGSHALLLIAAAFGLLAVVRIVVWFFKP